MRMGASVSAPSGGYGCYPAPLEGEEILQDKIYFPFLVAGYSDKSGEEAEQRLLLQCRLELDPTTHIDTVVCTEEGHTDGPCLRICAGHGHVQYSKKTLKNADGSETQVFKSFVQLHLHKRHYERLYPASMPFHTIL